MPTLSELKGRPVISLNEGEKLGAIKDALVDPSANRIGGFLLQATEGDLALPFAHVRAIGPDAVTVESAASSQSPVGEGGLEGNRKFSELAKQQVVDAEGKHHGHLGDITFSIDGSITDIEIRSGGFLGIKEDKTLYPISVVRSFGASVVTVEGIPQPEATE
jgi:uncharacterized protein YrrD